MESSNMSPNSVATELCLPAGMGKISRPPMSKAASERGFRRSSSEGDNDASKYLHLQRRNSLGELGLAVSASTRGVLARMDEAQVQDALERFREVTQRRRSMEGRMEQRRLSGLKAQMGKRGSGSRRGSDDSWGKDEAAVDKVAVDGGVGNRRTSGSSRGSDGSGRKFSQSMVAIGKNELGDIHMDGSYSSDEDEGNDKLESLVAHANEGDAADERRLSNSDERRRLSKSMGAMGDDAYAISDNESDEEYEDDEEEPSGGRGFDPINRSLGQVKEDDEAAADHTFAKIVKRHSDEHGETLALGRAVLGNTLLSEPKRNRPSRQRRAGMLSMSCTAAGEGRPVQSEAWKPLSSIQKDLPPEEDDEEDKQKKAAEEDAAKNQGGLGGFWNKLASSFVAEKEPQSKPPDDAKLPKPKKEVDGATYFRRGKKKAGKCQFLQAVALYNFALVRQREELGENHVDCATTLNEIGVCWMMLGERYPALTAFEEALYIRQMALGDGAREVAETTNNIWMILHEERTEMEDMMEEGDEDEGEE